MDFVRGTFTRAWSIRMTSVPETSEAFTAWYVRENAADRLPPEADALAKRIMLDLKNLVRTGAQQSAAYRAKALEEIRKLEALIGG